MSEQFYTLKQFAAKVEFHPETIRQLANKGKCGRKILSRWRFDDEDIERITEKQCQSESVEKSGTSSFSSVEKGYDALLAQVIDS